MGRVFFQESVHYGSSFLSEERPLWVVVETLEMSSGRKPNIGGSPSGCRGDTGGVGKARAQYRRLSKWSLPRHLRCY